jgi:hypothetical protein
MKERPLAHRRGPDLLIEAVPPLKVTGNLLTA